MRIFLIVLTAVITICIIWTQPVLAGTAKNYCEANYRSLNKSMAACMENEAIAKRWLATNPIQDDIYSYCKNGSGDSLSLLKDCVSKETYVRNTRSLSPFNLKNSEVWYASSLIELFPSLQRVCGRSRPIDAFAVLPDDITKFHLTSSMIYVDMLPILSVKGNVEILPFPESVSLTKKKNRYNLYLEAFLVGSDGKVVDIASAEAKTPISSKGGKATFSFNIGKGYYFEKGARILVVASGEPITSDYPEASCLLLGAKRLTFKK